MTIEEIHAEIERCNDGIDRAYWAFTRQARAKPPVMVVPHLYTRRSELRAMLMKILNLSRSEFCDACGQTDGFRLEGCTHPDPQPPLPTAKVVQSKTKNNRQKGPRR